MYYLDMFFPTQEDIPDFGTIRLTDVGNKISDGTAQKDEFDHDIDMRIRKYILLEDDIDKLSSINNAADGSKAYAADTGKSYILCNGLWRECKDANMVILTEEEYEELETKTAFLYLIVEDEETSGTRNLVSASPDVSQIPPVKTSHIYDDLSRNDIQDSVEDISYETEETPETEETENQLDEVTKNVESQDER